MSRAPPATGLTRCTNLTRKQRVWLGSVMNIKTTSWDHQQFFSVKNTVFALDLPPDPDPLLRLVSFGLFSFSSGLLRKQLFGAHEIGMSP